MVTRQWIDVMIRKNSEITLAEIKRLVGLDMNLR